MDHTTLVLETTHTPGPDEAVLVLPLDEWQVDLRCTAEAGSTEHDVLRRLAGKRLRITIEEARPKTTDVEDPWSR